MSLVALDGLTKRYPGGVLALDALSVSIEPGIVGLVGANGAGKSTLIKILLGLLPASSGSARVFDLDVARQGMAIRQRVGYMPEHDCLPVDISASDFVNHMARMSGLPRASARERAADVLRHVGLFEERYRPMGGYSTGMKQRVKLAQALVHDPRLLLLDEPTNGLDPAGRDEMLELIRRTGTEFGIAIIMASHLLGEIERVCDYLVAIDAGRLLRAAALGTFMRQTGILLVEVEEAPDDLARRLTGAGLSVHTDGHQVLVEMRDEATFDAVRDGVTELGLGLVRLEPRRGRLEDLFREPDAEESGVSTAGSGTSAAIPGAGDPPMPRGASSGRAA
jgi:ABC-2 type transport system ATP-binding protein